MFSPEKDSGHAIHIVPAPAIRLTIAGQKATVCRHDRRTPHHGHGLDAEAVERGS
jgi:hypothetical protein